MPIDKDTLDSLARSYARTMTSTRGKRVYRLLMREFSRFDHVLPALAEDDIGALLALSDAGGAAICRTDGRGSSVAIAEWIRLARLSQFSPDSPAKLLISLAREPKVSTT
jgi:hypothetical protein